MTTKALTLAALMLATTTLASTAEAGGVRLSFGGPLGSFVAHPNQSSGPGGTARKEHCAKPEARHYAKPSYLGRKHQEEEAPVRLAKKRAAPKVEVAEETPAPRKIRKPKIVIDKPEATEQVEVQTAKLDDKSVVSDVTPSIFVPDAPVAASEFSGTQSTAAVIHTAALSPAPAAAVSAKAPDENNQDDVKPAKAEKSETAASKICRRFSAAIAGLIEIPCGN